MNYNYRFKALHQCCKRPLYGKDLNRGGVLAALGYSLIGTEFAGKGIIVPELTSASFVPADGGAE
ncbi:MAG: hypothetical protein M1818_000527 [Claussenomyces sp. TS43310]|nr:MAG: hypothetical protein M1818_000527 [Claussenomyces sp. TS43310]